jgi:hypothetical protein
MRGAVETFSPALDAEARAARLDGWAKAVAGVIGRG